MNKRFSTKLVGLSFILSMLVAVSCDKTKQSYYDKPSILAGFKEGTFFDVHLLLYPDSTYYFSNLDGNKTGIWTKSGDTIHLVQKDSIQAILVGNIPTRVNNERYNWLEEMQIIEHDPPIIVRFPKHN